MTFKEEPGVYPQGAFTAWADDENLRAEVRRKEGTTYKVVKRLRGESAWSDAVRLAGDWNVEHNVT